MKKIAVVVAKTIKDEELIYSHLDKFFEQKFGTKNFPSTGITIITGEDFIGNLHVENYAKAMGWYVYRQIPNRRLYRGRAYNYANLGMIERSDELIIFWDGHELITKNLIKMSKDFGKNCHIIQTQADARTIRNEDAKRQAKKMKKEAV